ncbi:MAG: oligosaccharide flippase family protein [Pseudomonadota bacterium]
MLRTLVAAGLLADAHARSGTKGDPDDHCRSPRKTEVTTEVKTEVKAEVKPQVEAGAQQRAPACKKTARQVDPDGLSSPDPTTTDNPSAAQKAKLSKRAIGGQGALLISGFAVAQACAFARNALLGQMLSKGDFGIAATITLTLQLVETLSDLGNDRLIVQSRRGDEPGMLALTHLTWVVRGVILAALIYLAAGPITSLFAIPQARNAFEIAALVPLIKGFVHLDFRWHQRLLNNLPYAAYEVAPQALALCIIMPVLIIVPDFNAVPWIILSGAVTSVVVSHACAKHPYRIALARQYVTETLAFGWPIWLSALPLIAVYQGDRILVGTLLGMEDLAAFTAAFMLTMVPGLLAAKVANALYLPILSAQRDDTARFAQTFATMSEATAAVAAAYVVGFAIAGSTVLALAFGPNYAGLEHLIIALAVMWALRMFQSVPGMALMAEGTTRPFLVAGIIRAIGLPLAAIMGFNGYGLVGMAWAGVVAEAASLIYVVLRIGLRDGGLGRAMQRPVALLAGVCAVASALAVMEPWTTHAATQHQSVTVIALAVFAAILVAAGFTLTGRHLRSALAIK